MTPQLTIGIAAHNRLKFLKESISSALQQNTQVPYEVLIIDDASSDGTQEYLQSLEDRRVRSIFRTQNGGESVVRNQAIEQSKTDWILWLDDDDVLLPHALETQWQALEKAPSSDIVYANLQICDQALKPRKEFLKYFQVEPRLLLYRLLIDNMMANGGTMIRRSVFEKVGLYDTSIRRSMDYDFWARAALKKCTFTHNDSFTYLYRAHNGNCIDPRNQDPEHHLQYSRVVTKILTNAPIEEIFPMFSWSEAPEQSAAQAMLVVALVYLKWDQFELAEEALEHSEGFYISREAKAIRGLLRKAQGRFQESAQMLTEALMSFEAGALLPLMKLSCLNVADDFRNLL